MLAERRKMTAIRRMEILVALHTGKSPMEILKEKVYLNPSQVYSLRQKLVDAGGDPAAVFIRLSEGKRDRDALVADDERLHRRLKKELAIDTKTGFQYSLRRFAQTLAVRCFSAGQRGRSR
jgi:hypothetical protein